MSGAVAAVVAAVQSMSGGVPVSTRLPADYVAGQSDPVIVVEVIPGGAPHPVVQIATVAVQVYAKDDSVADSISDGLWWAADEYVGDALVSLTPAIPPAPRRDPDNPSITRWQLTLTITHVKQGS